MDFKTIISDLARTLAQDAEIADWCLFNFSRRHKVYIGIDPENPPDETKCPYLSIATGSRGRSDDGFAYIHGLAVSCVVADPSFSEELDVVTFSGWGTLHDLAVLVERKATQYFLDSSVPVSQPSELTDEVVFPFYRANWLYVLTVRNILGQ